MQVQRLIDGNFHALTKFGATRFMVVGCFFDWHTDSLGLLSHHAFALVFVDAFHVVLVNAQERSMHDTVRVWDDNFDTMESIRVSAFLHSFSSLCVYRVEQDKHLCSAMEAGAFAERAASVSPERTPPTHTRALSRANLHLLLAVAHKDHDSLSGANHGEDQAPAVVGHHFNLHRSMPMRLREADVASEQQTWE